MSSHEQRRPRAVVGRPARNRGLRTYAAPISPAAKRELDRQAELVGVKAGTYMRLVVAEAHDVPWSPLDLESRLPLPMAISSEVLRHAVASLDRRGVPMGGAVTSVRLDPGLASLIEQRADALGVDWGPYIAAVLAVAAGTHPALPGHQPSLLEDVDREVRMSC